MTHANYCHYLLTLKKIQVNNESEIISIKYTCHHAQKDISEILEQLPSSKDISEAHRVF